MKRREQFHSESAARAYANNLLASGYEVDEPSVTLQDGKVIYEVWYAETNATRLNKLKKGK